MAITIPDIIQTGQQTPQEEQPKSLVELFKEYNPEPKPIDESKVRASRTIAGVGEGLSLLGQMIGARSGARIKPLQTDSPIAAQQTREDAIRGLYEKRSADYTSGLMTAAQQDVVRKEAAKARGEEKAWREGQFEYQKSQNEAAAIRQKTLDEAAVKDREEAKRLQQEQINMRREEMRLAKQQAALALEERKDKNEFERRTKQLSLDIAKYAAAAKSDPQWLTQNQDIAYAVKPSTAYGAAPAKYNDDEAIAYSYYQFKNPGKNIYDTTNNNTPSTRAAVPGGKSRL